MHSLHQAYAPIISLDRNVSAVSCLYHRLELLARYNLELCPKMEVVLPHLLRCSASSLIVGMFRVVTDEHSM